MCSGHGVCDDGSARATCTEACVCVNCFMGHATMFGSISPIFALYELETALRTIFPYYLWLDVFFYFFLVWLLV